MKSAFALTGAAGTTLSADQFVVGAAALDANDRIITYDHNGNVAGGEQLIAVLSAAEAFLASGLGLRLNTAPRVQTVSRFEATVIRLRTGQLPHPPTQDHQDHPQQSEAVAKTRRADGKGT